MTLTFAEPSHFWVLLGGAIVFFIVIPALISFDHKSRAKFYKKTVDDLVYLYPRLQEAFPRYYDRYGYEYGRFGYDTVQKYAQTKRDSNKQRLDTSDLRDAEAILAGKMKRNKDGEVVPVCESI